MYSIDPDKIPLLMYIVFVGIAGTYWIRLKAVYNCIFESLVFIRISNIAFISGARQPGTLTNFNAFKTYDLVDNPSANKMIICFWRWDFKEWLDIENRLKCLYEEWSCEN